MENQRFMSGIDSYCLRRQDIEDEIPSIERVVHGKADRPKASIDTYLRMMGRYGIEYGHL
jgi:hypothetical protein